MDYCSGHFNVNVKKHVSIKVKCLTGQLFRRNSKYYIRDRPSTAICNCCVEGYAVKATFHVHSQH